MNWRDILLFVIVVLLSVNLWLSYSAKEEAHFAWSASVSNGFMIDEIKKNSKEQFDVASKIQDSVSMLGKSVDFAANMSEKAANLADDAKFAAETFCRR